MAIDGNPFAKAAGRFFKAGVDLSRNLRKAKESKADYQRDLAYEDAGRAMVMKPTGISQGVADGMRAGSQRSLLGATRGIEAELRRNAAGARGGSQLATRAMLLRNRNMGQAAVEKAIADRNLAAQKFNVTRGLQMDASVTPVRPEMTESDAKTQFFGDVLGAGTGFLEEKRQAKLEKAKKQTETDKPK